MGSKVEDVQTPINGEGGRAFSTLCDPDTHEPLTLGRETLTGETVLRSPSGRTYPIRDGIIVFIDPAKVSGLNLWHQRFYDRLAPWYDAGSLLHLLYSPATRRWRVEYLQELAVEHGSRVLEVSVGTGANLQRLPSSAEYVGLDLSWGMLRRCRRKLQRRPNVILCQGLGEYLPFQDGSFDVVFHVGGINFFSDKARALAEMVRVARPGARVMIVDGTERFARRYERTPILASIYRRRPETLQAPVDLLPAGVTDVRVKEIADGELYCLTCRTPDTPRH